ncbi:MAG: hypothetical protein Q8L01_03645 [Candidatus Woesebacteria bacterium]|nr:hypothetical protein [Candidatus Woesebacteria bacterium]
MCGEDAVSSEHVPARGFFPEEAEYRKDLITVPSCKKHNEDTSSHDEYVRNFITTHEANNHLAFRQFKDKVTESLKRSKWMLGPAIKIQTQKGTVYAIQIQRWIFDQIFRKIAYALYFFKYGVPWNRELIILTRHLVYGDLSTDDYGKLIVAVEEVLPPLPTNGKNPLVFKYSFLDGSEDPDKAILCMTFYEGFTVWFTVVQGSTKYKF